MKLINKYLMILLFIVCNARAMNEVSDVCYLNKMPADVLNYIARFLMETEGEFVARTKDNHGSEALPKGILSAACPDKINCITLGSSDNKNFVNPKLVIRKNDVLYEGMLNTSDYGKIALSRGANMIGICYGRSIFISLHKPLGYECFLEIQKIKLQKNEKGDGTIIMKGKHQLPCSISVLTTIAFNKQGTHLIVHSKNVWTQEPTHEIFSLKNCGLSKPQARIQDTNKLQIYLRDKFVCDKYIMGTK